MKKAIAVLWMGRPLVLVSAVFAHALGTAMAYGERGVLHWGRAGLSLVILLAATTMAHYADEYADRDTDALTRRTLCSGGSGVLPAGLVPPAWALIAAAVCALLAALLTVASVAAGWLPWAMIPLVGLGMAGGWVYSMPPLALERHGWGEIDNALLGGILMPLSGYIGQTGALSLRTLGALVPITLAVFVNLLSVHWADRAADGAVGRRSIPVLWGTRTRALYLITTILIFVLVLAGTGTWLPLPVVVASWCTLPIGVWAAARFARDPSPLPGSILMMALFLAQTIGWVIARIE